MTDLSQSQCLPTNIQIHAQNVYFLALNNYLQKLLHFDSQSKRGETMFLSTREFSKMYIGEHNLDFLEPLADTET